MSKEETHSDVYQKIHQKQNQKTENNKPSIIDVLKIVSPGSVLRDAIDDILRAEMGSLIVVDSHGLRDAIEGGFKVNCELTSQRIVELAKMDGAIILSSDLSEILKASVLLTPDTRIPTNETGTRHKAAERIAKQAETLVIAISERRKKISVYYGDTLYILQNTQELLSRATETLQILEKQREIFTELLANLNVLEISGLVVANDVCSVLQRIEIMMRTSRRMDRYLIELGKEGFIIRMRVIELLKNINREREFILKDYNIEKEKEKMFLGSNFDELLDLESICELLFGCSPEDKVSAGGFRILGKTSLEEKGIQKLIKYFKDLDGILNAEPEKLEKVLGTYTETFQKEISSLKEQIMMARKI